mgnify:CR=1 FL=1
MNSWKGKKILVTGISSAIGAVIARALLEKGCEVFGTYRTEKNLHLHFPEIPDGLIPISWAAHDSPTFLDRSPVFEAWVHCIGAIQPQPIKYLNPKGNQDLFAVNYFSATELASKLLSLKKMQRFGSIVFLSSVSSHYPYRGGATYAASKAALETFSKALALECSHLPIRVNSVVCGLIRSTMLDRSVAHLDQNQEDKLLAKYPLGIGEPKDVANACIFLLSNEARWITGSQLLLDGGLMLNS